MRIVITAWFIVAALIVSACAEDDQAARFRNVRKLDTLIFKDVELKDVSVRQVLEFLNRESKNVDPSREGILFYLEPQDAHNLDRLNASDPMRFLKLSLSMKSASARSVLCAFIDQTYGLDYMLSAQGVHVSVSVLIDESLFTMTWKVPAELFDLSSPTAKEGTYDVSSTILKLGFPWTLLKQAEYTPSTRTLYVRFLTRQGLRDLESYLARETERVESAKSKSGH